MPKEPAHIKTISQYYQMRGLGRPLHPLIGVVDNSRLKTTQADLHKRWVYGFYTIALKRSDNPRFKMKYGQNAYDYDGGVMFYLAPGQVLSIADDENEPAKKSGWGVLVHPDFLHGTPLAKTIKTYEYFKYATHEALFLSEKEEQALNAIVANIERECQSVIDKHSQRIIVSQIETLLAYSNRFYERQFITRKPMNHHVLEKLEEVIDDYFKEGDFVARGMPSVSDIAGQLHLTPNYLSTLLKHLTGQSTQYYIHNRLIETAKEKLSTTSLSVSQIAFELGFDYPQSFSKLFKSKTNQSPMAFRKSLNAN